MVRGAPTCCLTILVASVLLTSRPALADTGRVGLDLSLGLDGTWVRSLPSMSIGYTAVPAHALTGGTIPTAPSLTFMGARADLGLYAGHHWFFPLLGASVDGAVGPSQATVSTLDGSVVESRPWTSYRVEALLPGIGYRAIERRWLFSGTLRLGVVGYGMADGVASAGMTQHSEATSSVELAVHVELKACRRLDPTNRACLLLSPSLYEGEFLNGGSLGLLWEYGR